MTTSVSEHYRRTDLDTAILTTLRASGKAVEALTITDLAPVDHFHIRGQEATLELALLAGVHGDMNVLDVGGGLGGPRAPWLTSADAR